MNNHGITKENLLQTFPPGLRGDASLSAIWEAVADLLAQHREDIKQVSIYPRVGQLEESLLDILAYDFKVDWWDSNYTLEEKQRTLQTSWQVHKTLGTKAAVEKAASAIYPNTTVKEWFEYEGEPFHFRINAQLTEDAWDAEKHKRLKQQMQYYKNLRSWLDSIDYYMPPVVLENHQAFYFTSMTVLCRVNNLGIEQVLLDGKRPLDGGWYLSPTFSKGVSLAHFQWGVSAMSQSHLVARLYFRVSAATTGKSAVSILCHTHVSNSHKVQQENVRITVQAQNQNRASAFVTEEAHRTLDGSFLLDGSKTLTYGKIRSDL